MSPPPTLPRPGRPADGGLASLGITMMTAATVGAAAAWIAALLVILEHLVAPYRGAVTFLDRIGWDGLALALGITAARGLASYAAGRALVDPDGRGRVARMLLYALLGLAHAAIVEVLIARAWSRAEAGALGSALATWPLAGVVLAGWFVGRDRPPGVPSAAQPQSVAVLALVAGLFAAALAAVLVGHSASDGALIGALATGGGVGVAVVAVLLIHAGVGGVGGGGVARLQRGIDRAGAAASLVVFLIIVALVLPGATLIAIPAVALPAVVLPALLRRHLDQAPSPLDPAGHGGSLYALGWLLLGHGLLAVTASAAAAYLGTPPPWFSGALAVPGATAATALTLGVVELWAAAELLRGSRRAGVVAALWAAAALVAASTSASWTLGAWAAPLPLAALLVTLLRGDEPAPSARLTHPLRADRAAVRTLTA